MLNRIMITLVVLAGLLMIVAGTGYIVGRVEVVWPLVW